MIVLTSRAARLTRILLELDGEPTTARELADRVGAGERAVRYDLDLIEPWLSARGLEVRRKPRVGIWVEGSAESRAAALRELEETGQDVAPVVLPPEERRWLILGWTLSSSEPVRVGFLAQILGVSRRTVYYDLSRLRTWLREQGLELACRRGRLSVTGDEMRCRGLMLEFLERLGGAEGSFLAAGGGSRAPVGVLQPVLEQIGDREAAAKVAGILSTAQRLFRLTLPANVMAALSAHILVVLTRVRQERYARAPADQVARLRRRPEWAVARWIAGALEEGFSLSLPEEETACLALYLGPSMVGGPTAPGGPALTISQEELGWCARIIVEEAGEQLGVNLMDDVQLRAGLVGHLYASVEKIRAGVPTRNPLLGEIRKRFPTIHAAASNAAERAGRALGMEIPDEEAGWIALHLGAALERLAQHRRSWTGVVVCPSGQGAAQMLQARLAGQFPNAVLIGMRAVDEAAVWEGAQRIGADVVVSTVPLARGPVPVVVVSPFLTNHDVVKLTNVLYARGTLNEKELLEECRARPAPDTGAHRPAPLRLEEAVREDLVTLGVRADTPEEAIRAAGRLLAMADLVTGRYVETMVELYRRFGPYFVLLPGIAIPHAVPEEGALQPGISVISLNPPVEFGADDRDPVDVVVALSCPASPLAFSMVQELLGRLQGGADAAIRRARSPRDVLEALREPSS